MVRMMFYYKRIEAFIKDKLQWNKLFSVGDFLLYASDF